MEKFSGTFSTSAEGLNQRFKLNNEVLMPWLGLGVFQMNSDADTESVVRKAIDQGYRNIDTAAVYGNERGVGAAVRNCGIPRESLFITSKVWNDDMRADRVEAAFEESMARLELDYLDLYLLHWPIAGKIVSSWKALEKFYKSGRIKAIGVSNYLQHHLEELLAAADIIPALNQLEFHPYLQIRELKEYCENRGIRVEAWSPFMHGGEILSDPVLQEIGDAHEKTPAQVILRWILQEGVCTIPKTVREKRLTENADIFDFELSEADRSAIAALDRGARWGADPANFNF